MTRTASAALRAMQPPHWRPEAYATLRAAFRAGLIKPPSACVRCHVETLRLVPHHEDYRKPLDVVWLCTKCHGWHHRPQLKTIGLLRGRNGRVVSEATFIEQLIRKARSRKNTAA